MKNLLPVFILALIVIVGCKRDTQDTKPNTPGETKYPVKISIADFSQDITDLRNGQSAKVDSLGNKIGWLYFLVYDSAGNWLHYYIQSASGNPDTFGQLTDSLPRGHYNMIVVGSKSYVEINGHYSTASNLDPETLDNTFINFHVGLSAFDLYVVDFFSKTVPVEVNADSTAVDITLERRVGMVEINISDAPADPNFKISPTFAADYYYLHADTGRMAGTPFSIPNYDRPYLATQVSPTRWQFLTAYTNKPFDVVLNTEYGFSGNTINHYKVIHDVKAYQNKKTILTGHFYDTTQNVTVGVNDAWDTASVNLPF